MKFIIKNDYEDVAQLEIGTLESEATLIYNDKWIANPSGFSLLPALDKKVGAHAGAHVRNFFENLLPESKRRDVFAKTHQLESNDIPKFLKEFGKDTSGAIQVYEENYDFSSLDLNSKITIEKTELLQILDNSKDPAITLEKKLGIRFSLAGAQEKFTTVIEENGSFSFPDRGGSSTHIIKPSSKNIEDFGKDIVLTPLNEHICMSIAREFWPETPDTHVIAGDKYDYFAIQRFDRIKEHDRIKRLHQFDICQLTGVPSTNKYERDGGPKISDILLQVRELSENQVRDLKKLQDWILYNLFIGNNDCHAKNFSFLYSENGDLLISPFYDLLSTNFYKKQKQEVFEMKFPYAINGGNERSMMSKKSLVELAQIMKIREADFLKSAEDFKNKFLTAMSKINDQMTKEYKGTPKEKSIAKIFGHLDKTSSVMIKQLFK